MVEDNELLRQYAEQDSEAAFAELVQRRVALVYAVALRQVAGDAHLAEEVTQRVFADLARKARLLSERPVLSGWLCRAAQFAASDVVRAERRRKVREKEIRIMHELMSDETSGANWERMRGLLDRSMGQLGERDRDAVALRFYEGRTFAEVGARLRLSEDAARMRIERALDKLHGLLARHGVRSTTAALALVLANQAAGAVPPGLASSVTSSALAGVGSAGAVTAFLNFFHAMATTKITTGIAIPLAILVVGTASFEIATNREIRAAVAAADEESAAVAAKLGVLRERLRTAEQNLANLKNRPQPAEVKAPAGTWDPVAEGRAFITRHPEYGQAVVDRARGRIAADFKSLYQTLALTPSQIDEFERLNLEGRIRADDTPDGMIRMTLGTGLTPAQVTERLHALLGEDGYRQFEETKRLVPIREFTLQLASALYYTDAPLTSDQANEVIRIVGELANELGGPAPQRPIPLLDPQLVMDRAQSVLTESQATVLREFLERQREGESFLAKMEK